MTQRLALDPSKSPAQRRLMLAAAHTPGGYGGVPQKVGKEFARADDAAPIAGAGILLVTPDDRALFIRRTKQNKDHQGEWDLPGGGVDGAETPEEAAKRETLEEIGALPYGERTLIASHKKKDGFQFDTFIQPIMFAFAPKLSPEHDMYVWAPLSRPPEPVHPGLKDVMDQILEGKAAKTIAKGDDVAKDALAMDRASVRTLDTDGRLHVSLTNISRAAVNPYLGKEIPDAEALGLDPEKVYMLLRDPEELAKAAATFNNLPLLDDHEPVSAEAHRQDMTVGATGTDAVFESPYLKNSLVIWTQDAIDGIESGQQREISCAYHYVADMTPGTFEGKHFDGVMRAIVGNHIALVARGRAGKDVVVGDRAVQKNSKSHGLIAVDSKAVILNKESNIMQANKLSRKALVARGALLALLSPKLAADKMPDLDAILVGTKRKNWLEKKPGIVASIKPYLAQDEGSTIDEVVQLLDRLDGEQPSDDDVAVDSPFSDVIEMLRGKISDEDLAAIEAKLNAKTPNPNAGAQPGEDEEMEDDPDNPGKKRPKVKAALDEPSKTEGTPELPYKTKGAMDKAIATAIAEDRAKTEATTKVAIKLAADKATQDALKLGREISAAEDAIKPYVGKLTLAFDSVNSVYEAALKAMGVKVDGVHPSAFKAILDAQPRPGGSQLRLAADAGIVDDDFTKRYPDANRLKSA